MCSCMQPLLHALCSAQPFVWIAAIKDQCLILLPGTESDSRYTSILPPEAEEVSFEEAQKYFHHGACGMHTLARPREQLGRHAHPCLAAPKSLHFRF